MRAASAPNEDSNKLAHPRVFVVRNFAPSAIQNAPGNDLDQTARCAALPVCNPSGYNMFIQRRINVDATS